MRLKKTKCCRTEGMLAWGSYLWCVFLHIIFRTANYSVRINYAKFNIRYWKALQFAINYIDNGKVIILIYVKKRIKDQYLKRYYSALLL